MHFIARALKGSNKPKMKDVFSNLSKLFDGSYNIAMVNADGDLIFARDPMGFRPLCYST